MSTKTPSIKTPPLSSTTATLTLNKGYADETIVLIDFNNLNKLSGAYTSKGGLNTGRPDMSFNVNDPNQLESSNLEGALSAAGYIKASACPKNSASQSDKPQHSASPSDNSKNNLWNGLSIAMTCATGVLLLTVMLMMIRRGKM